MSVRHLVIAVTAALVGGVGLAAPAAARVSAQPVAAGVYDMSAGRVGAIVAALAGLLGLVIGVRALVRSARRTGSGRNGAAVAVAAGVFGMALGGLVAATADGGLGTGNGLGGAYVALLVGLAGTVLGGLALARSRRVG
ncbi:hypothetical protein GCM10009678_57610 [Actinomadura kijaniata]|uniref:Uncharacterized protein n=1 Tax=Actinomadura namibiensis TaxID=182080 RepID=A0A7W3LYW5_ACTNM|nr:DUF6223 family protein [Actinomadura namibiensis]MBA8956745.1 hypothetical protein [Actinomadura namibiensis]